MKCRKDLVLSGFRVQYVDLWKPNPRTPKDLFKASGLRYVGHVSHERVKHGQPLPCFEPVALPGQPDINTAEGCLAFANKYNSKAFYEIFGREPMCEAELRAWEDSHFSKDFRWGAQI